MAIEITMPKRDFRFRFRPARVDDAFAISQLIRAAGRFFVVNPDGSGADQYWDSVSESSEAARIADPDRHFIVAECDGQFAGFAALRQAIHLFHLFVAPQFQRQGLATQLWALIRAEAARAGNNGAITVNASLNAVPVYTHFGFVPTDAITQKHGIEFLPMRWLPPA